MKNLGQVSIALLFALSFSASLQAQRANTIYTRPFQTITGKATLGFEHGFLGQMAFFGEVQFVDQSSNEPVWTLYDWSSAYYAKKGRSFGVGARYFFEKNNYTGWYGEAGASVGQYKLEEASEGSTLDLGAFLPEPYGGSFAPDPAYYKQDNFDALNMRGAFGYRFGTGALSVDFRVGGQLEFSNAKQFDFFYDKIFGDKGFAPFLSFAAGFRF